jgi:hypothetical protein
MSGGASLPSFSSLDVTASSLCVLTYSGTKLGTEQGALHTGHTRRVSFTVMAKAAETDEGSPSDCLSPGSIPGSSHRNRHGQQYRWPHCVTTGSVTASKHMLQLKRASDDACGVKRDVLVANEADAACAILILELLCVGPSQ